MRFPRKADMLMTRTDHDFFGDWIASRWLHSISQLSQLDDVDRGESRVKFLFSGAVGEG